MDRLGPLHIAFLQHCAEKSNSIHKSDLPVSELEQMVQEGLLIKYNKPNGLQYCITRAGASVARSYGASPEITKLAVDYVISKGYEQEAAEKIVAEHGAESILMSQAEELKGGASGQREVVVPMNEQSKPEIKFRG